MTDTTIKLGRMPNGKLRVNSSGKLCRGCCPDDNCTCGGYANSVCPACYQWNIPESVTVNLSGLTVASECQYSLSGSISPWPGNWCTDIIEGYNKFDFDGSAVDGSYEVPLTPHQGYSAYYCGGQVDIPFSGHLNRFANANWPDGTGCDGTCGDFLSVVTEYSWIRINVFASYCETSPPYNNYKITITITVLNSSKNSGRALFYGVSDPIPASPQENRAGFNVSSIENGYNTPYVCEVYGGNPCYYVDFVSSWGGSVSLSNSESLYPFGVHLKTFGPGLNYYANQSGAWVSGYVTLDDDALPHHTYVRIRYEVSCDYGSYIGETCSLTDEQAVLSMTLPVGQYPGFTTIEILSITCDAAPNLIWDSASDEVSHLISGVINGS